ncbi:MAG: formate dehydrogenase accessory protein FdhE [Syntrophales bacterium]|jgi:FdhE protein|nr:formate dehydrogenase accessory protein FdhE [Syntrophales bacterium]
MAKKLNETLKTIESYKAVNPHYVDLLDILEAILILREAYKKKKHPPVFSVDEALIPQKIKGGLPLVDLSGGQYNLTGPKEYFHSLLTIAEERMPVEAQILLKDLEDGTVVYEDMIRDIIDGCAECEEHGEEHPEREGKGACETSPGDTNEDEEIEESFDLIELFLEESLRPDLELIAEKYGPVVDRSDWLEGYCPICGKEPKIGELREEEERRYLFCNQCGYEWDFVRIKCPFCGNEEQQSLAFFTVEGDDRYRVDVCNECKRYIKIIDFRETKEEANLDVEDIATLHLDMLAYEEGYN